MPGGALGDDADEEGADTAMSQSQVSSAPDTDRTSPVSGGEGAVPAVGATVPDADELRPTLHSPEVSPDDTLRNQVPQEDEEETRLDPRAPTPIPDDDATRRDPFAQAVALDELRRAGQSGPIVKRYTPVKNDYRSSHRIAVRPPSETPMDEVDEETRAASLDSGKLFADIDPRRVGGTALLVPEPQQYSALPADVSVYIKEDSLENLAAVAPRSKSRVGRWVVGILLAAIAAGCLYVLTRP
jgi:hypothetical protein